MYYVGSNRSKIEPDTLLNAFVVYDHILWSNIVLYRQCQLDI